MKLDFNRRHSTYAVYAALVLMAAVTYYLMLSRLPSFLDWMGGLIKPILPIVYGFGLAYLLNPVMLYFERQLGKLSCFARLKPQRFRSLTVFLTMAFAFATLFVFSLIVLPQVIANVARLGTQLSNYMAMADRLVDWVFSTIPEGMIPQSYLDQLANTLGSSLQSLLGWISTSIPVWIGFLWQLSSGVISAFVAVVICIYLLASKEKFLAHLRKILYAFLPARPVRRLTQIAQVANGMFSRFITGKIIDSMIIGVLCFAGLSVLGMPNVILVSFIVGVTNVLPYFGPFIGAAPGFLLIAIIDPLKGVFFLLFILVLQQVDGNIIGPMILGDSTGLSAFWVVFAILFFGGAFGIFGMFIGVPTFAVIYYLIKEASAARLAAKGMPTDTAYYLTPLDQKPNE